MLWLLITLAHAAPCEAPASMQDLAGALGRAEVAFSAMDEGAFSSATGEAEGALRCLAEPLTPPEAAAWHRVAGLGAFLAGDGAAAGLHFAASRELQPGYQLPSSMAPAGHPLRGAWDGASPGGAVVEVGPGEAAWLVVDGRRSATVPADRPALVQWVADSGAVTETRLVLDAAELPPPVAVGPPPPPPPPPPVDIIEPDGPPPPPPEPRSRRLGLKVGLGTVTAGAAIGAFTCWGLASQHNSQFWDATVPPSQLEHHADKANAYSWTILPLGVIAAAGGTSLVLTW